MHNLRRQLTHNETQYVLYHLSAFVSLDRPITDILTFPNFEADLRTDFRIDNIPVLFPLSDKQIPYVEQDGHIVFCHDLLKSAFYLLSAYQEYASSARDQWGRYPYEDSIQKLLSCERTPIVCYYFEWILAALQRQCQLLGLPFRRLSPLGGPRLHLSHDIDLVRYNSWRKTIYRFAQVVGLRPCDTSRLRLAKAAVRSLIYRSENPYWSFSRIQDNEVYLGYRSSWFVLLDDGSPFPPDYSFTDPDLQAELQLIAERGNEVGLHSSIGCNTPSDYRLQQKLLSENIVCNPQFNRKHFLSIDPSSWAQTMANADIKVDCSFGFSTSEGFRNSYCFPFHPFDHQANRMLPLFEVPLSMMDVTMLHHKAMSFDDIFLSVGSMLDEVRHFGGLFSLLWHNSTFDETYYPGICRFYEDLHTLFAQYQLQPILLSQIASNTKI